MAFRTIADLEAWMTTAGLAEHVPAVRTTARPTALFGRELVDDEPLPIGTHKFGGHPDLPAGMPWPERPALPDADAKGAKLLREARRWLAARTGMFPETVIGRRLCVEMREAALQRHALHRSTLSRPFPLAFVVQFDLADLAQRGALDPALPRHGLLSLFTDVTWRGHSGRNWVFWHHGPMTDLRRAEPPGELVSFYETAGVSCDGDIAWRERRGCERLHPFAAVTIPDQWWEEPSFKMLNADLAYHARLPFDHDPAAAFAAGNDRRADFADQLGGWPATLQGQHPEWDLPGTAAEKKAPPGRSPWRVLYAGDNQFWGGTRFMSTDRAYGDRIYVMIRADALRARRFGETVTVYAYE